MFKAGNKSHVEDFQLRFTKNISIILVIAELVPPPPDPRWLVLLPRWAVLEPSYEQWQANTHQNSKVIFPFFLEFFFFIILFFFFSSSSTPQHHHRHRHPIYDRYVHRCMLYPLYTLYLSNPVENDRRPFRIKPLLRSTPRGRPSRPPRAQCPGWKGKWWPWPVDIGRLSVWKSSAVESGRRKAVSMFLFGYNISFILFWGSLWGVCWFCLIVGYCCSAWVSLGRFAADCFVFSCFLAVLNQCFHS